MKINFPKTIASLLLGTLAILCAPSAIFAQAVPDINHTWNGPPGSGPSNNWFDVNNWLPTTLPTSTDNAQISNGGTARITTNGTNAMAQDLALGLGAGTSGNLNVVNNGKLDVSRDFFIGNGSSLTLSTADFTDTATVTTGRNGIIGNLAGSMGRVRLTDSAGWTITGDLRVGDAGDGELRVFNVDFDAPAFVVANRIVVGNQNGSTGVVELIGPNNPPKFLSATDTVIGNSGDGTFRILDGGFAVTDGNGFIGRNSDGVGRVRVSGFNIFPSEWSMAGNLAVGNDGQGTLQVLDGGAVFVGGSIAIGRDADSTGRVEVDGFSLLVAGATSAAGSTRGATGLGGVAGPGVGDIFVGGGPAGPGGDGVLRITNGGAVLANNITVWGPGTGNKGLLEVDSTYIIKSGITFDGGRLRFLDDTDFINDATLGNTQSPDGVFVDTNGTTSTISGVFSGPGGLVKRDTGTLIMTNTNTYTGDTLVHEGTLQLDGSITSNTDVDFDGTLTGTGTIFGNLRNRGVVAPGDSPGTLTVTGNYLQTSNGDFSAEVGGLNSGVNADLLTMGGTASLAGSIHVIRFDNFMPVPGDRVTVLHTDGGRGGSEFETVVPVGWLGLIQPFVDYPDDNTVDVVFELSATFVSQAITRNQICVAENVDAAVDLVNSNEAAHNLIAILGSLPPDQLPEAFNLLGPEEFASIYEISFQHGIIEMGNYRQRMSDIRAGAIGYCELGAAPTPMVESRPDGKTVLDGKTALPDKTVAPAETCPDQRWGMFASGYGQGVNVGDDEFNDVHGYDIMTGGFSTGFDALVTRHFAIGIGGGYASSTADLVNDGRVNVETGYVAGYATVFFGGFYVDGAASGGWNSIDTSRLGFGGIEDGSTNGREFNGIIGGGYDWKAHCWTIGPFATFHYTYVEFDGFDESGGSAAPLHFPDQNQDAERGAVGLKVAYDMTKGNIIFRPEVRAAFQHEFNNTDYAIDFSFRDIPTDHICDVFGPSTGDNSALIDAGFSLILGKCHNVSAFAFYSGNIGRDNDTRHGVNGGLRLSF